MSGNRPILLEKCLQSLDRAHHSGVKPRFDLAIVVVVNGAQRAVEELVPAFPQVKWVRTQAVYPSTARNLAIEESDRDWLFFLDDDACLPEDYFDRFLAFIEQHPGCVVVGGPDRTPPQSGLRQQAMGLALQSPFATGPTRHRFGSFLKTPVQTSERMLILCNLWIRRSFLGDSRFDDRFFRNEENVLLADLESRHRESKGEIWYDPDLYVFHERKSTSAHLFRAFFCSGVYRARSIGRTSGGAQWIYALPSLWLVSLVYCSVMLFGSSRSWMTSSIWVASPVVGIVLMMLGYSVSSSLSGCRSSRLFPLILGYQFAILTSYGAGYLSALIPRLANVRIREWVPPRQSR